MKIKVFTKVGLMKNERWTKGVLLEEHENIFLVDVGGEKFSVEKKLVKPIFKLDHDDNGRYPALDNFVQNNWCELKYYISNSVGYFFPDIKIKIDEENKILECESLGLSVTACLKEIETISSFKQIPVWEVVLSGAVPATKLQPEDYSESLIATETNNLSAAKVFIDSIWKFNSLKYWNDFSITNDVRRAGR
jgi:hypothetical protein